MTKFSLGDNTKERGVDADYDRLPGIKEHIRSLGSLFRLLRERRIAGYQRDERLREWILFDGAIYLDTCGNAGRGKRGAIQGDVFSASDFYDIKSRLSEEAKDKVHSSYGHGIQAHLPRPGMVCPVCMEEWTIRNFLDSYTQQSNEWGELLSEGDEPMTRAQWSRLHSSASWYKIAHNLTKNGSDKPIKYDDETLIEHGDEGSVYTWKFYHPECLRLERTLKEMSKLREALDSAGFTHLLFTPVENEYWGYPDCSKWFVVQTELCELKVGWRKRVINVESECGVNMASLVPDDDKDKPTRGENYLHCWGYEKFTEYMTTLRERLLKRKV